MLYPPDLSSLGVGRFQADHRLVTDQFDGFHLFRRLVSGQLIVREPSTPAGFQARG